MRTKYLILLILLSTSLIPVVPSTAQNGTPASIPPAPVFISVNNTGIDDGNYRYEVNTSITIQYKADRFAVEGVVLLGSGSGLTKNVSDVEDTFHFAKISSLRDKSTYEVELQVKNYTYFYAYAWYGSLTNGTNEEYETFFGLRGHQLWLEEGPNVPDLHESGISAPLRGEGEDETYFASIGNNVTIQYRMIDPFNVTDDVTIVFAENSTALYNSSLQFEIGSMTKIDYTVGSDLNFSYYEYNFTMDRSIAYFTAYNDYGWEQSSPDTPEYHLLTNGFVFNETYAEDLALITQLDDIEFNITTYNQTDDMVVGYQFRHFNNSEDETPTTDWQVIDNLSNITYAVVNSSANGYLVENSTEVRTYSGVVNATYEVGNLVEIQSFVKYGDGSNMSLEAKAIVIIDANPILTITSQNATATNGNNATVVFNFSTPKGEIDSALLTHTLPTGIDRESQVNIENLVNYTILFSVSDADATIVEGNHTVILNITNSLGLSVIKSVIYRVDHTNPVATINNITPDGAKEGRITVSFSFSDGGNFTTGIREATLDWKNNIVIDVSKRTQAVMQYRTSNDYDITLTVTDVAGNQANFTITITVTITPTQTSTSNGTPAPLIPFVIVLLGIALIGGRRKRN